MGGKTTNLAQSWPVRNDMIVLMLLGGATQKDVAEQFKLTKQHISKIANDPRAEAVIQQAREKITENLLGDMEEQLDLSSRLSAKVLNRTLNADISPVHKAKGNQDRVAVAILRGRGFLSQEDRADQGLKISPVQFDRIAKALAKADEAQKIDPFAGIPEAEVVEVTDG